LTVILALGVRAEKKSVEAMRAATTKQTVVKKPKTFWARVIVECIFAYVARRTLFEEVVRLRL
jgi:hypothetical protein